MSLIILNTSSNNFFIKKNKKIKKGNFPKYVGLALQMGN